MMLFQLVPKTLFCSEFSGTRRAKLWPKQYEDYHSLRLVA